MIKGVFGRLVVCRGVNTHKVQIKEAVATKHKTAFSFWKSKPAENHGGHFLPVNSREFIWKASILGVSKQAPSRTRGKPTPSTRRRLSLGEKLPVSLGPSGITTRPLL